jgi:MvaI/BcnI restriction endonuclease family
MFDSIQNLAAAMAGNKPLRLYAKKLAPNDNSKNQIYLGGGFAALNVIPHGAIETDQSDLAGSVRDRAKAIVNFQWLTEEGMFCAPNAQLILYPKYPEVRISGFLKGCSRAPSDVLASRDTGRVFFIGVLADGQCVGFAVFGSHPLAKELETLPDLEMSGIFIDLTDYAAGVGDTKSTLLQALCGISRKGWMHSVKLNSKGNRAPYLARNGGGYTLEAELGISPNSCSEPDYLGWEVKQYGVADFINLKAKSPVTLMTPEPTGGVYKEDGVERFLRRFGYADKSGVADRINFGGIYTNGSGYHDDTKLAMRLSGYDNATHKILDMGGGIQLADVTGTIAAQWNFTHLIEHWNTKHAKAVYVPSQASDGPARYRYSNMVTLCEGTDFLLFLRAVSDGVIYLDPGVKLENANVGKPLIKRRNQFRIKQSAVPRIYVNSAQLNACGTCSS